MKLTHLCRSLLFVIMGTACVDIQGPAMEDLGAGDVLAEVQIRSSAILVEIDDSLQIDFDLVAANNERIPYDQDNIKWSSTASQIVAVTNTGMIHGRAVSSGPIKIGVQYVHKYVTRTDTVNVYVTDGRVDANAIRLISLDSSRVGSNSPYGIPRVRVDLYKDGALVEKGALIPIQITAPAVATLDRVGGPDSEPVYRIQNNKSLIGKFWIRASVNLYGNEVEDSLGFTGLYGSLTSGISIYTVPANNPPPIPILDTIPLNLNQICGVQLILNLSTEMVDVVFSDSTVSSTACRPGDADFRGYGLPFYGEFIGGNVASMPPMSLAVRKTNTPGVVSHTVRKSATKETLPWFIGHIQQVDVDE